MARRSMAKHGLYSDLFIFRIVDCSEELVQSLQHLSQFLKQSVHVDLWRSGLMLHLWRSSMRLMSDSCLRAWTAQSGTQLPLRGCLRSSLRGTAGLWNIRYSACAASSQASQVHAASLLAKNTTLLDAVSICSRNLGREPDEEIVALVSTPYRVLTGSS